MGFSIHMRMYNILQNIGLIEVMGLAIYLHVQERELREVRLSRWRSLEAVAENSPRIRKEQAIKRQPKKPGDGIFGQCG